MDILDKINIKTFKNGFLEGISLNLEKFFHDNPKIEVLGISHSYDEQVKSYSCILLYKHTSDQK